MKNQQHYRKLTMTQREKVDEAASSIQAIFDKEKQDDTESVTLQTTEIGEVNNAKLTELLSLYKSIKEKTQNRQNEVVAEFQEFTKDFGGDLNKLSTFCADKQEQLRTECTKELGKLCAFSIAQLSNIGEWCSTQGGKKEVEVVKLSTNLCHICDFFDQELTKLSTLYVDAIQGASTKATEAMSSVESAETTQAAKKQITQKTQQVRNAVYVDLGSAISNIQEAKRLILNIVKFLVTATEAVADPQPKQPEQPKQQEQPQQKEQPPQPEEKEVAPEEVVPEKEEVVKKEPEQQAPQQKQSPNNNNNNKGKNNRKGKGNKN